MNIYVVQSGDTLEEISRLYDVSVEDIAFVNQLVSPYRLAVGQALLISAENGEERRGRFRSNGYAYPFISPWVLEQTLPYLSALSVFSYGFDTSGNLVFPQLDDAWMVRDAKDAGTQPVLTLTPLDSLGRFNNNLISAIVNDMAAQDNLISQLIEITEAKGYEAVDVDFEYILREDRDGFTRFVENLTEAMHEVGKEVSVALAPKTSATQTGLLYEGKDYPALGAAADRVLLMTYEWGYKYGPNMAVAPLNLVRRVVEYAVTEIPRSKINLGIANYGYDWPLPYVRSETVARTIGNVEAVQIAVNNGAEIQFDEVAQSPFFQYTENGVLHEVWFEDVRSIQGKYDLIEEFGLEGAGWWQIMRWWRACWVLLEGQFEIVKVDVDE